MSLTIDTRKQFYDENADFEKQEQLAAQQNEALEKMTSEMT